MWFKVVTYEKRLYFKFITHLGTSFFFFNRQLEPAAMWFVCVWVWRVMIKTLFFYYLAYFSIAYRKKEILLYSHNFAFCYTFITSNFFNSIREPVFISLSISHNNIPFIVDIKQDFFFLESRACIHWVWNQTNYANSTLMIANCCKSDLQIRLGQSD